GATCDLETPRPRYPATSPRDPAKYVDPISTAGTKSSGARRSHTCAWRRSGRSERGGSPRMVSRLSATASLSSWRFTRSTLPGLIARPLGNVTFYRFTRRFTGTQVHKCTEERRDLL